MSYVVAFIDQDTCRTYLWASQAPMGSVVFSSPEELARSLPVRSMDSIRGQLLGEDVETSPSRDLAATRLWYVLGLGAQFAKFKWTERIVKKDAFGNPRSADNLPTELVQLTWVRGRDHMADAFYKKLAKQEGQIVDMLVDDGRRIWTNEQAFAIIQERAAEIKTRQPLIRVWDFYRSQLYHKKILRKVSYAEFSGKPEFEGMSIQDKEDVATQP